MNPSGLAVDRSGNLFVSCRNDGTIHRVTADGRSELWIEGMGVATGLAFDGHRNLCRGPRRNDFQNQPWPRNFCFCNAGTFRRRLPPGVSSQRRIVCHRADYFSFDRVYRISAGGDVTTFFRGLGRPQGLAFDRDGNLLVAASLGGRRGIVRITPAGHAELALSGGGVVGMALLPSGRAIVTTSGALFALDWDVRGLPLLG